MGGATADEPGMNPRDGGADPPPAPGRSIGSDERLQLVLASLGAEVTEVDTVFDTDPVGDFLTVMGVCQLRTMRPFMDHPRWEEVDPILRAIVDAARFTSAEELVGVFDRFHRMNLTLIDLFHEARILVTPTCAGGVPLVGQGEGTTNGVPTPNWAQFTYPFNMTRSPAATVCAGLNRAGLPVGLQLVGPQHGDLVVLRTAAALEAGLLADRGHELLALVEPAP